MLYYLQAVLTWDLEDPQTVASWIAYKGSGTQEMHLSGEYVRRLQDVQSYLHPPLLNQLWPKLYKLNKNFQ